MDSNLVGNMDKLHKIWKSIALPSTSEKNVYSILCLQIGNEASHI
jgi:hypothetical protein